MIVTSNTAKLPKKAAIYARVSSQRQKEGETIDSQVNALLTHAQQKEYHVPEQWIFIDNGLSGTILQRPALDSLRDLIRTEPVEAILIYAPDRLSRKYSHQLILLEEFRKRGVYVCFLKAPSEGDTPEAKMLAHMQGIFAEYERSLIVDRSRRGRIYKAKQGDPCALPSVPYGYRRSKKGRTTSVFIEEIEAGVVREIFRLYIIEERSLTKIAKILSESDFKSPKGNSIWDKSTVRDILKNRTYTGTSYFGKTERCDGIPNRIRHYQSGVIIQPKYARKKRPEEEWIPINVPQLISESDFEMVQEQLKKNKQHSMRNTKEPGLLQGLLVCGECGHQFYKRTRRTGEKKVSYYHCRTQNDSRLKKCKNPTIHQLKTDEIVYNEVINLLKNPSLIEKELARRAKEASNTKEIARQEIVIKKEITKLLNERDRLLDAYQSGVVDLGELRKRNLTLDQRLKVFEGELKAIQALKIESDGCGSIVEAFDAILKRMQSTADELSFADKQKLVRLLVKEVVVGVDDLTITHCVSSRLTNEENVQLIPDGRL